VTTAPDPTVVQPGYVTLEVEYTGAVNTFEEGDLVHFTVTILDIETFNLAIDPETVTVTVQATGDTGVADWNYADWDGETIETPKVNAIARTNQGVFEGWIDTKGRTGIWVAEAETTGAGQGTSARVSWYVTQKLIPGTPPGGGPPGTEPLPPDVTSITPDTGTVAGNTAVTIVGTSLTGVNSVKFDNVEATNVVVVSDTTVTCTTPPGAAPGDVDVQVTNPDGFNTISNGFTYLGPPTVTLISPNGGPRGGGTPLTLSGNGFIGVTTVTFNGVVGTSLAVVDMTTLNVTAPPSNLPGNGRGAVDVIVTNSLGAYTVTQGYTYT
jgi:hypothetical protein